MAVIPVAIAGRGYDVHIAHGLLEQAGKLARGLLRKQRVCVVADAGAWTAQGERLVAALRGAGREPVVFEVPAGEGSKSWAMLARLTDWLIEQGVERSDHVIAFGGGVVGDLTGFACAILKRGCGFIQVPTTLLAQVDSSVGGKTAINTTAGKNLVGAFHQPALVLADLDCLATLPERELRAGYAEVLKYGVLGDAAFFAWLEQHGAEVLALDPDALEHAVATSVGAKARIVAADERETTGARALLNLGHTFGHALEAETGFSDRLLHGESVALGMVLAARCSLRRGLMNGGEAERVARAVSAAGLPAEISRLSLSCGGAELVAHMRHDKKMDAGTLPFVLLRGIGGAFLDSEVLLTDVARFLDEELAR